MANRSETMFSAREIRYLQSLPAVESVTQNRIRYTERFKRDCMRRYSEGESPAKIFRSAGLDSSLIGYKRIERCVARWGKEEQKRRSESSADAAPDLNVPENERWAGNGTPPVGDRRRDPDRGELDAQTKQTFDLIIAQQARRIDELERKIRRLESHLSDRKRQKSQESEPDDER